MAVDRNGKRLRPLELIKVDFSDLNPLDRKKYPFNHEEVLLYLGEVHQMPGHLIVVSRNGLAFWGYHADHFRKLRRDEV